MQVYHTSWTGALSDLYPTQTAMTVSGGNLNGAHGQTTSANYERRRRPFSLTATRSLKAASTTALRFRRPSAGRADCRTGRDESASSGAGGDSLRARSPRPAQDPAVHLRARSWRNAVARLGPAARRRYGVEALSGRHHKLAAARSRPSNGYWCGQARFARRRAAKVSASDSL